MDHLKRVAQGEPSVDPLDFSDSGELLQMKQLGMSPKRIAEAKKEMREARGETEGEGEAP